MLLRKLTLTNYGLFAGKYEFDLVPRPTAKGTRPIVLIGGKNGAGKTTVLESVRLALYGRLALGPRIRTVDYSEFLRSRIHRGNLSGVKPAHAAIAVEFDHVHRGAADRYLIERSWRQAGKEAIETLAVSKNGLPLDDVDSEVWPAFVRDIIPEGLAQLFFFDGEKIQELAEDATGSGSLADSIKSLLGLDLVERLNADLDVYANRQVSLLGTADEQARSRKLEAEIARIEALNVAIYEEMASLRTRIDGVHAEIRRAEEHLRREGEDLARRRERLSGEKANIEAKIEEARRSIREECDHLFPMALCPNTAKTLQKQLRAEQQSTQADEVRAVLLALQNDLLKSIKAKRKGKGAIGAGGVATTTEIIKAVVQRRMPNDPVPTLHGLSDTETKRAIAALATAKSQSGPAVTKLCESLERWTKRLEVIERNLAQIPSDDAIAPRVEALALLQQRLGGLEQERSAATERLNRNEIDLEQRRRELRRMTEQQKDGEKSAARISLARTVQRALADYLSALTDRKVAQLRDAVAECFNRLSRKGDIVERVQIDPRTFVVTLFDRDGTAIPKEELSSGEKQIFAIAMLWGLAKTSGRPLPVIIDTPLGRLDSDHRRKLIHDYLPFASHQVLVLSTDTEVDQALCEELKPHISHAYHLSFARDDGRTSVSKGYFWNSAKEVECLT